MEQFHGNFKDFPGLEESLWYSNIKDRLHRHPLTSIGVCTDIKHHLHWPWMQQRSRPLSRSVPSRQTRCCLTVNFPDVADYLVDTAPHWLLQLTPRTVHILY